MDLPILDVSHKWNQTVSDLLCLAVYSLYTIPILALCLRYYYSRFADGKNKAWSNCAAQGHRARIRNLGSHSSLAQNGINISKQLCTLGV